MATIARLRVVWTGGFIGEPGLSTFFSSNSDPSTYLAALHTFFDGIKGVLPNDVAIVFPGDGDTINDATGELNGSWSATAPATVVGTQSGAYAGGVGCRVVWKTAGITRGRRVRGSTFLCPIAGNQFDDTGNIEAGALVSLQSAAGNLADSDSGSMRIWSRPQNPGGSDGASHAVTAVTVPDKVSWLRSRRT